MATYRINEREDSALMGLSMLAQLLYIRGFRARMDFTSGIAGGLVGRNLLFYHVLAEVVSYEPDWGSRRRAWRPSKGEVRSAIGELERAGLLVDAGSTPKRGFVKKCVFADRGSFVQKRNDAGTTQANSAGSGSRFSSNDNGLDDRNDAMNASGEIGGTAQHPVSGKPWGVVEGEEIDSPRARVDRSRVPASKTEWFSFFVNVLGFRPEKTWSAKLGVACDQWVVQGVNIGVVLDAVEVANQRNGGSPVNPVYYIGFVDDQLREVANGRKGSNATGGRSNQRISAAERNRREGIEYARQQGIISDDEWEAFKQEIGEPDRADPFRTADDCAMDAHERIIPGGMGFADGESG